MNWDTLEEWAWSAIRVATVALATYLVGASLLRIVRALELIAEKMP